MPVYWCACGNKLQRQEYNMSTRIKPNMWIDQMSGKTCNKTNDGPIFRTMSASGRIYVSHIHSERTAPFTEGEVVQQERFKAATAATKAAMEDPVQLAAYSAAFKNQHKYFTLRGYIFAQEMAKL